MYKQMTLTACVALAASLAEAPAIGRQGPVQVSIVASVGHSEWCRTGTVQLNLATGRYTVRAPATWRACRRPVWRTAVRTGLLTSGDMGAVRAAWRRAEADGLEDLACARGGQAQRIVIGNGGTPIMRVTRGARTVTPPGNQGCWSQAALRLHRIIRDLFDPRGR